MGKRQRQRIFNNVAFNFYACKMQKSAVRGVEKGGGADRVSWLNTFMHFTMLPKPVGLKFLAVNNRKTN